MVATIQESMYFEQKRKDRIYSWMTRSICVATTLDVPRDTSKSKDPINEWIQTLTLDPDELEQLKQIEEEKSNKSALNDEVGSMERLIGMFSRGQSG